MASLIKASVIIYWNIQKYWKPECNMLFYENRAYKIRQTREKQTRPLIQSDAKQFSWQALARLHLISFYGPQSRDIGISSNIPEYFQIIFIKIAKGWPIPVFRKAMDPARIGLAAHTAILHKLVSMGFEVLQPLNDDLLYDLACYVEETSEFVRVQCKAGRYDDKKGCIYFNNFSRPGGRGNRHSYRGEAVSLVTFTADVLPCLVIR